jgi:cytochrome b involved in lipid metabolism
LNQEVWRNQPADQISKASPSQIPGVTHKNVDNKPSEGPEETKPHIAATATATASHDTLPPDTSCEATSTVRATAGVASIQMQIARPSNIYSLQDVGQHNSQSDMWIAIGRDVYDVTKFKTEHPGGEKGT